jgi:hypothetical protein
LLVLHLPPQDAGEDLGDLGIARHQWTSMPPFLKRLPLADETTTGLTVRWTST